VRDRITHDALIVGSGLFGAVCAHELTKAGFSCLVLEKRDHIGGNCYTERRDGINVHAYGAHIFHTHNRQIWNWINQFCEFNNYRHKVKVNYRGRIFSFPVNLETFQQLWAIQTPAEAQAVLAKVRVPNSHPQNIEEWVLAEVGQEVYQTFFKGYTEKQWDRPPSQLPVHIIKRLPIRFTSSDLYFDDAYQGIPKGGYTQIFDTLLKHSDVRLHTDYFDNRAMFDACAHIIIYTGPIDRFFDYKLGRLDYRSLRFRHLCLPMPDYQGVAVMNYTAAEIPFTRIIEHKHFEFGTQEATWITEEYPQATAQTGEPMYPVRDDQNSRLAQAYQDMARSKTRVLFGGRLAEFRYYDMHQVIGSALVRVEEAKKMLHSLSETAA